MTATEPRFVPYRPPTLPPEEALARVRAFRELLDGRRAVRQFSTEPVPREVIEEALRAAGTAASGAHIRPSHGLDLARPRPRSSRGPSSPSPTRT